MKQRCALLVGFALLFPMWGAPAVAQEEQKQTWCQEPGPMIKRASQFNVHVFGIFENVTAPSGVHVDKLVIFEVGDHYMLVGFTDNCMDGFQEISAEQLQDVLDHITRRAKDKPGA